MLDAFRNVGQSWVAKLLLVLIALSFVLWGVGDYFTDRPDKTEVAEVDGTPISQKIFQERYKQESERYRQMLGKDFTPQMLEQLKLKEQVLDALINYQVLVNESKRLGLQVTDAEVVRFIQGLPVFSDEKGFSKQRYEQLLAQQGLTPTAFEAQVREELAVRQLEQGITVAPLTTPQEVAALYAISEETRNVQVAFLPAQAFSAQVSVTPAEVEQYYKTHQAEFKLPERVKVNYVILGPEQFAAQAKVSEEELKAAYEKQKSNFTVEEQRRARHILISVPQDASAEAVKQAQDKAETLVKQLRGGADFAALAKAESQDPGSAAQGGELGFFGRGTMVKPFEDAVFALKPGEISAPVRTPFGFHIIQLEEIRPAHTQPFEDVRAELENQVRRQKAEQAFDAAVENFKDVLFTQQTQGLAGVAKEFGLQVEQSDWLTRDGPAQGVLASPNVVAQAFSAKVLQGKNSDAVDLPDGRVLAMHLAAREPAKQQDLASVRERISTLLKEQKAEALAKESAQALLKAVQAGQSLSEAARAKGYQVDAATVSRRNAEQLPQPLAMAIFKAPPPAAGKVSAGTASMPGGAFVYSVDAVNKPAPDTLQAPIRQQIADFLQNQRGNQAFRSYLQTLRAKAEVKVYKDKL